ncbi:MAG: hypothetical protein DI535_27850 [Citrobacter freundii]|nr:MAG: hypothetical protein DI535_27850 [Citrobacter freundii]
MRPKKIISNQDSIFLKTKKEFMHPLRLNKSVILHSGIFAISDPLQTTQASGITSNVNAGTKSIKSIYISKIANIADNNLLLFIFIILIFFIFGYYLGKRKKMPPLSYQNALESFNMVDENFSLENNNGLKLINPDSGYTIDEKPKTIITINDETIKHVLARLTKFEKSQKYLKHDMSLSGLASYLDVNTKYLSEILKTHKEKKFSDYINGLRIKYIIEILQSNPKYREYKISYLAKSCGFASREVFAVVFKKETGISPSFFINDLKQNEVKE